MNPLNPRNKVIVFAVLALFATVGIFAVITQKPAAVKPVLCAGDTQVCPDGTTVGRVAPRCEFSSCPVVVTPPDDNSMKAYTYIDSTHAIEYVYPRKLTTKFID